MNTKEQILKAVEMIPEPFLEEILDFILFLKYKSENSQLETTLLSEASLQEDWLKPEEDEAWQHL